MVVINPFSMPKVSLRTLATGARQLVVHDALLMMWCFALSYSVWLMPNATVMLKKSTTVEEINAAFKKAADGALKGVLQYNDEPTVSIDYNDNPHSAIFDSLSTLVMEGNLVKVLAWYDNEWGYSNRMVDIAKYIAGKL